MEIHQREFLYVFPVLISHLWAFYSYFHLSNKYYKKNVFSLKVICFSRCLQHCHCWRVILKCHLLVDAQAIYLYIFTGHIFPIPQREGWTSSSSTSIFYSIRRKDWFIFLFDGENKYFSQLFRKFISFFIIIFRFYFY